MVNTYMAQIEKKTAEKAWSWRSRGSEHTKTCDKQSYKRRKRLMFMILKKRTVDNFKKVELNLLVFIFGINLSFDKQRSSKVQ